MIKNERQYRITSAETDRFEKALASRPPAPPRGSEIHPRFWEAEGEALAAQLAELRQDIAIYEALQAGQRRVFGVRDLAEVPKALIEGRIASGLTQKELGNRLNLAEQAIQRYEATDYASASLDRLCQVAAAIGIELSGLMRLRTTEPTPKKFFLRLKEIGLDRRFVLDRLLPPAVAESLEGPRKAAELVSGALLQAAAAIERIFRIDASDLFGDSPISLDPAIARATRFKRRRPATGQVPRATNDGYVVFAHYLGLLALQTTKDIPRRPMPNTSAEWRTEIRGQFGAPTFEHFLRFLWRLGIPVLPLRDEGEFHGACWRTGGREVIVLKQRSLSEDRWAFDMLHECGHIIQEPASESFSIIEDEVPSADDPAERKATHFAAEVVLDGRADELAERAVGLASGNVQFLERAAARVAAEAGVPIGALANFLAFRIAEDTADEPRQINWWATAARLQRQTDDPWRIARDIFLEHADLTLLNQEDRELLIRSLMAKGNETRSSRSRRN